MLVYDKKNKGACFLCFVVKDERNIFADIINSTGQAKISSHCMKLNDLFMEKQQF